MPAIIYSVQEIADQIVSQMRSTSAELLKLADLDRTPLNPGESPDVRRHQLAKLGKKLAELVQAFDGVITTVMAAADSGSEPSADPVTPESN